MKQEPEEDCRAGKRHMGQQEEGPRGSACRSASKTRWPSWGQRRSAGREQEIEREMHPRESRRSCPWTFP